LERVAVGFPSVSSERPRRIVVFPAHAEPTTMILGNLGEPRRYTMYTKQVTARVSLFHYLTETIWSRMTRIRFLGHWPQAKLRLRQRLLVHAESLKHTLSRVRSMIHASGSESVVRGFRGPPKDCYAAKFSCLKERSINARASMRQGCCVLRHATLELTTEYRTIDSRSGTVCSRLVFHHGECSARLGIPL
jgi:hypothetical protein